MADREVDQQLVERAQRGDKRAFELLVLKYQRKLGRLLSRWVRDPAEVEDVTQEAFVKAYRALPTFRGDSAFYTWLYRIAINTAKNYLVALGRRAPTSTSFDNEEADGLETWVCYHAIGDALRGSVGVARGGFAQRFAAQLAEEPTVLAPQPKKERQLAAYAWAAAAGVAAVSLVGWVAFNSLETDRAI